jgi:hypothetical protein
MPSITGHRDSVATQCPGTALSNYLATLRINVTNRLAPLAGPAVSFTTLPPDKQAAAPASLTFNWSGASRTDYQLSGERLKTYQQAFEQLRELVIEEHAEPSAVQRLLATLAFCGNVEGSLGLTFRVLPLVSSLSNLLSAVLPN